MDPFKRAFQEHHCSKLQYVNSYDTHCRKYLGKQIKLLEIGVREGDSLKAWRKIFPTGQIYGIDIDSRSAMPEFIVGIFDQSDTDSLVKFATNHGPFDIVIDDGSHYILHIIASFNALFENHVSEGGVYVIEDVGCSYVRDLHSYTSTFQNPWGQHLNNELANLREDFVAFQEHLFEVINTSHWQRGRWGKKEDVASQYLKAFHHYRSIIFLDR